MEDLTQPYVPGEGLSIAWVPGASVLAGSAGGCAVLAGNAEGFLSLSFVCATLAQDAVPLAECAELGEWNLMEEGSQMLFVQREDPRVPASAARMLRQTRMRGEGPGPSGRESAFPPGRGEAPPGFVAVQFSPGEVMAYADAGGLGRLAGAFREIARGRPGDGLCLQPLPNGVDGVWSAPLELHLL